MITTVIELNGGLVQCVYNKGGIPIEVETLVIDWDRDEEDEIERAHWALDTLEIITKEGIKVPEATLRDLRAWINAAIEEVNT